MNIKILSREQIENISAMPFPSNTALISIHGTNEDEPTLLHKPEWILKLIFDDISSDEIDDYSGIGHYTLFNENTARDIAGFVAEYKDKAKTIICQCEYGQSRSAAVAAALLEYLYKSGIEIFADDRYYPNKLVFRLTLKALKSLGQS